MRGVEPQYKPIRSGLFLGTKAGGGGGGGGVSAAHISKTIKGIGMKLGRPAENHKQINLKLFN